jgi:hypothetical protein
LQKSADKNVNFKLHSTFLPPGYAEEKGEWLCVQLLCAVVAVFIGLPDQSLHLPARLDQPSWFDAGKEDAMNGLPVKDNQTLADSFNDPR